MVILGNQLLRKSNTSSVGLYQYWQIINTNPADGNELGKQWIIRELQFLDSNNEIISVGGIPQAYSFPGTNPNPAFDNNLNTFVSLTSQSPPTTGLGIGYKFAAPVLPYYVQISNLNNGYNIPPSGYSLQKSTDNINWINHQEFTLTAADSTFQSVAVLNAILTSPTVLLLKGVGSNDSTNIIDNSQYNRSPSIIGNGAIISTAKNIFDGSSIYFDGSGALNYQSQVFNVGSSNCTIEVFFNPDILGTVLFEMRPDNSNGSYPQISFDSVNLYVYYNGNDTISAPVNIITDSWYYLALRKINNITELWLQGSKVGQFTSGDWANSGRIKLGSNAYYAPGTNFKGYMSNFRFTHGLALDVSAIPTQSFSS